MTRVVICIQMVCNQNLVKACQTIKCDIKKQPTSSKSAVTPYCKNNLVSDCDTRLRVSNRISKDDVIFKMMD